MFKLGYNLVNKLIGLQNLNFLSLFTKTKYFRSKTLPLCMPASYVTHYLLCFSHSECPSAVCLVTCCMTSLHKFVYVRPYMGLVGQRSDGSV